VIQTATAPDGVGLKIMAAELNSGTVPSTLCEDGKWSDFGSPAEARAAAWDRYIDRWKSNPGWEESPFRATVVPGHSPIAWTTYP
jgi:hypothetical protein